MHATGLSFFFFFLKMSTLEEPPTPSESQLKHPSINSVFINCLIQLQYRTDFPYAIWDKTTGGRRVALFPFDCITLQIVWALLAVAPPKIGPWRDAQGVRSWAGFAMGLATVRSTVWGIVQQIRRSRGSRPPGLVVVGHLWWRRSVISTSFDRLSHFVMTFLGFMYKSTLCWVAVKHHLGAQTPDELHADMLGGLTMRPPRAVAQVYYEPGGLSIACKRKLAPSF